MKNKPTVEQTAWVLKCVAKAVTTDATYRDMIYKIMDYDSCDIVETEDGKSTTVYCALFDGLTILNTAYEIKGKENG